MPVIRSPRRPTLDELPPHTAVRIDGAALDAEVQTDVAGWLGQQPDVIRVDPSGPEHHLLVGPDVDMAATIDGTESVCPRAYGSAPRSSPPTASTPSYAS